MGPIGHLARGTLRSPFEPPAQRHGALRRSKPAADAAVVGARADRIMTGVQRHVGYCISVSVMLDVAMS